MREKIPSGIFECGFLLIFLQSYDLYVKLVNTFEECVGKENFAKACAEVDPTTGNSFLSVT